MFWLVVGSEILSQPRARCRSIAVRVGVGVPTANSPWSRLRSHWAVHACVDQQQALNHEAHARTIESSRITFFSRSGQRLWEKGEASGNYLEHLDCDRDEILVQANPRGPTCHTGNESCFGQGTLFGLPFFGEFSQTLAKRRGDPRRGSYTSELFAAGADRLVQKVGEEALEVFIEGKNTNEALF